MPKNIVICCDGTMEAGFGAAETNVLKLYKSLQRHSAQVVYYQPGIWDSAEFTQLGSWWRRIKALAFGTGSSQSVAEAYQFLMQSFDFGDNVYIFGFSRGAYIARALCGLLHLVGLLDVGNERFLPSAIRVIKQKSIDFTAMANLKKSFSRVCNPYFVGVWDTVSSLGWVYDSVRFPFTRATYNPDLTIVRHALAIDERRAFFRANLFGTAANPQQDVKEIWFAGVHSDIGAGYAESESQLSKITLRWMMSEAETAGLLIDPQNKADVLGGNPPYVAPDPETANLHESLHGDWWLAELWPKIVHIQGADHAWRKGLRVNLGRRRYIAPGSLIHESVAQRMQVARLNYKPANVPPEYSLVADAHVATAPSDSPAPMSLVSHVPILPTQLIEACAQGKGVLFAGAGLSAQAGLPTWKRGLESILRDLAEGQETREVWRPLLTKLSEGDTNTTAQLIATRLTREDLQSRVQKVFARPDADITATHGILQEIPFAFALTENWDDLLEKTFRDRSNLVLTPKDSAQFVQLLRGGTFFVLKAYGDCSDSRSFLFTAAEYQDAITKNPDYSRFILSLFSSYTVLFVGLSLSGIEDFVSPLRLRGQTDRLHYALVPHTPDGQLQAERFEANYSVKLLFHGATEQHREVKVFLQNLAQAVKAQPPQPPDVAWSSLKRVELANIGPFIELVLDLDPSWNVLLANNGLGKSTLLKSIALGLCGNDEKAVPAAKGLLRVSENSGSIRLRFGEDVYESQLVRDGSDVKVRPRRYTALQSGSTVAIGFPPLRGVSQRNISGVAKLKSHEYPVVDDLLPLISGSVDSRVDDLKQWIVNTAIRARTDSTAARMRDTFFDILKDVSKDLRVTYNSISETTFQVLMNTADGVVPLESLSQGMSSVIGWVGALIERMFEIYPKEEHPERMPALVLVDEIDAHMHPAWQQVFVSALSASFIRVQFIVSTHSPLIVAGLEPRQVYIFERDAKGVVRASRPEHALKGVGAGGLLTSGLFGLVSQLDIDTANALDEKRQLTAKRLDPATPPKERERIDARIKDLDEKVEFVDATKFVRDPLYPQFVEAMSKGVCSSICG